MLTIYRASAGSGKTYTLTGEYLRLISGSRDAFRHVLAVTFTNKATAEMKERVVDELSALADGRRSHFLAQLIGRRDEKQVRQQTKETLSMILHDYSSFNISTIDHFFQQTVRAFCREIGLQGGYDIEMDAETVLDYAIDNLLAHLDLPENKKVLDWLTDYAILKIQEGKSWNIHNDLANLGKLIFKENFQVNSRKLQEEICDLSMLKQYRTDMFMIIRSYEYDLSDTALNAVKMIKASGLELDDFKNKTSSGPAFFYKIIHDFKGSQKSGYGKRFAGMLLDPTAVIPSKADDALRDRITHLLYNGLLQYAQEIVDLMDPAQKRLKHYKTALLIKRNFSMFGILNHLAQEVARYRDEKNVMLISDTSTLLSQVIDGSDTPFVYERIGATLDHFMIDEFQDTSRQQWLNFRPLLLDSLSRNQDNLIVGDVKQSIYRFRNSDWKLLQSEVNREIPQQQLKHETLHVNWRSCRNIVEFNNAIFAHASRLLQTQLDNQTAESSLTDQQRKALHDTILSAYSDSYQLVAEDNQEKAGHVSLHFVDTQEEEKSWNETVLNKIPLLIAQLQDNDYALKDIAILVRYNREAAQVAQTLLTYAELNPEDSHRYSIISNEALVVSNSEAVRLIIAFMRWIADRDNENLKRYALCSWIVGTGQITDGAGMSDLPYELKQSVNALSGNSLYETAEGLYRLFSSDFPQSEQVYLLAFLDMVSEYGVKEMPDLNGFLQWWDERGMKQTLATPNDQDAVTITTIHQSKGLGFKAVIIPFCNWMIDGRDDVILCHPTEAPFNSISLLPVNYNSSLAHSIFSNDYFQEKLYNYVDNLNDLYVAFTRAKEELILFAPYPVKEVTTCNDVGQLLWQCLNNPEKDDSDNLLIDLSKHFDVGEGVLQLGEWWHTEKETKKSTDAIKMDGSVSAGYADRLHLSLHGHNLFSSDIRRRHGMIMHELLSLIRKAGDMDPAVEEYLQQGMIDEAEATKIRHQLQSLFEKPEVAGWFDGTAQIMNEITILSKEDRLHRPDRVMITPDKVTILDYKFGNRRSMQYHRQVLDYMNLVRGIGYKNVEGYLWYVELDRIDKVNG